MSLSKPISNITENDLLDLVKDSVQESKSIDYKKETISDSRDDKKEFLADVSSFANASGGHIVFGMDEENGIAKELIGLSNIDPDAEILRLDNIIRDGIEPRIFGITIKPIKLSNSNVALVIYIPNSWAKPHLVNFSKHWRFYSRNSAGKYPLDYLEVKSMFLSSDSLKEKVISFRRNRISNIIAGETPIELQYEKESYFIYHLLPANAFELNQRYNIRKDFNILDLLRPIKSRGYTHRSNFDGILTYTPSVQSTKASTYLQLYNNGIIEAVDTSILNLKNNGGYGIPGSALRREINELVKRGLALYQKYQIQPPFFVMFTLIGVKGYIIWADPSRFIGIDQEPIDRDNLIIPEILIEDYDVNVNEQLKYFYDSLWNAAGWEYAYE
jgi:hypothetical protein